MDSFSLFKQKTSIYCFLSLFPSLTLNVLTYLVILGISKTNGLLTLSKYAIKYLELVFVLINFEIAILSTLTSQIFKGYFAA